MATLAVFGKRENTEKVSPNPKTDTFLSADEKVVVPKDHWARSILWAHSSDFVGKTSTCGMLDTSPDVNSHVATGKSEGKKKEKLDGKKLFLLFVLLKFALLLVRTNLLDMCAFLALWFDRLWFVPFLVFLGVEDYLSLVFFPRFTFERLALRRGPRRERLWRMRFGPPLE